MAFINIKKRIVRDSAKKIAVDSVETRDAILWEILTDKTCRVKIPGSETYLIAKYPENIENTPAWMKLGNSVKVMHTSGNRNSLEIVGSGQGIPSGTGPMFPTIPTGPDAILTGMQIQPFDPPMMGVWVETGTYRLNSANLELGLITIGQCAGLTMSCGLPFNKAGDWVAIDASSSTQYRIDILVIDADGVLSVVKGTNSSNDPQKPSTPANKVLVGSVFIPPNTTSINYDLINRDFVEPYVCSLRIDSMDSDLEYPPTGVTESYSDIVLSVLDQYGNGAVSNNWGIEAALVSGTGKFSRNNQGYSSASTPFTVYTGLGSSSVTIRYWRELELSSGEESPMMTFTLKQDTNLQVYTSIMLRDEAGGILV